MVRLGEVTTIRRGAYVPGAEAGPLDACTVHTLRLRATLPLLGPAAVVSHLSAAVLHGWPLWAVDLDRVHVTQPRRSGGRRSPHLHVHTAPMEDDDVVVLGGIRVTAPARTAVDLARTLPFEQAVVVVDAALARGSVTAAELVAALARAAHRPGNSAARRAVAFADGRSESVGESRSRIAIARAGLPVPTPQWEVRSGAGVLLGRSDFGWPELRTVGEFDGRIKYGRLLRPGQEPGDAVFEEKRREDAIRDEDLRVVRWVWDDLRAFGAVARRLERAFRRV